MSKAKTDACLFVIFGATGDLMQRKLLPALVHLSQKGQLPKSCHILGVARGAAMDDHEYLAWARTALTASGSAPWADDCIHYQSIGDGHPADYQTLSTRITELEHLYGLPGNRVLYLALPPAAFPTTIEALGKAGLNLSPGWTRLVIEKPFGRDLESARELNALVHTYFEEQQVFRIDHYLGKETVQNLLAFRFGNALFESAWNRDHIRSVHITVAEELGVEGRASYYEQSGALRDMVQNHLTQLLTLTAMDAPAAFEARSIRFEKVKVLRSVAPIRSEDFIRGQYTAGMVDGQWVPAYRDESGAAEHSQTETFVALRLAIDNWRWQGVPFYLCTGKRLARRGTEINIQFRSPPVAFFRSVDQRRPRTNALVITVQPNEGFDLSFEVKSPGDTFTLQTQHMNFSYAQAFGPQTDSGYETLLLEVLRGEQTLFVHAEETEASWELYTPLLMPSPLHFYPAGSNGPQVMEKWLPPVDRRAADKHRRS